METLIQDVRYAARMLLRSPGLTAVAVLSLALGIGANSTIFSWAKAILFQPMPGVAESNRLVVVAGRMTSGGYSSTSYPDYVDIRDNNEVLSGLIAYDMQAMSFSESGEARRIYGSVVSGNYFDVLGVKAALGRTFLPDEDLTPNTHPVAVIGHGFWQRRFAGDPNVIGNTMTLNSHPFTIIGVAPENFAGTLIGFSMDVWVPMMMSEQVVPGGSRLNVRGDHWFQVMGRLKPGVSQEQAEAAVDTIARQLAEQYPNTNEGRGAAVLPLWKSPWGAGFIMRPVLFVLSAVVGLVLLIACANVANLLLARAVGRRKEIAIRLSMGASRARLIRQLLTESLLLALLGGAGGVLVAYWGSGLFMAFIPAIDIPVKLFIAIDSGVLGFTLAVSLVTGIIFGLAPALQASNPNIIVALKDESARAAGSRGKARLRNALVVAQVALSLILLIGAALFLKTLQKSQTIDVGFDPRNMLLTSLDLFSNGYTTERGKLFQQQLVQRVGALAGVESVTLARSAPLGFGGSNSTGVAIDGYEPRPGEQISIEYNNVGPNYFHTMGIPLIAGRDFTARDDEQAPRVVVINETMARRYWPGQDPLGKQLRTGPRAYQVAGVAKDIKYHNLGEEPQPYMYFSMQQFYKPEVVLHARVSGDPTTMLSALRQTVASMDPNLPLFDSETMTANMSDSLFPQRIAASLLGLFGLLALVLAAVGLYGVMAHSVTQRTHEIGIRMALGARASDVLRLVVGQGMRLALVGVAAGLAGSFALTRFLSSLLYGVSATDIATFAVTPLLLVGVALVACFVPARRAARVDPMVALRYE
jgi:predicted permease